MDKVDIIGVKISVTNMTETLKAIEDRIKKNRGGYISVSNVHTTVMAKRDKKFAEVINNAFLAVPDGKPLSWYGNICGFHNMSRVTGPDLMLEFFEISEQKGYSNYFYGGTEENLQKLLVFLKQKYPNLKVVGAYSPPFRKLSGEEDEEIINKINEIKPNVIWVGLGAPKQEIWMHDHCNKINSLMIGVGAAFNFVTGEIRRAPNWMQNMGLEWLYRFIQEPRRLWRRYLVTNSLFIYYSLIELIKWITRKIIRLFKK